MAEPRKDMSKDKDVIEAIGYGFDASVRKGTAAGQKAMEGFMSKLSEEQKMFARDAFNKKIASQSKVLDNKSRIAKGEEQAKVYRAAGEKGRKINYQKEFGPKKAEPKIPAPKKTNVQSSAPKADTKAPAVTSRLGRLTIPGKSPAQKPTPTKPAPTPAAPVRKAMGMPAAPKTVGSGPSQMMAMPKFDLKKKK
jgi:hypothetical protein